MISTTGMPGRPLSKLQKETLPEKDSHTNHSSLWHRRNIRPQKPEVCKHEIELEKSRPADEC